MSNKHDVRDYLHDIVDVQKIEPSPFYFRPAISRSRPIFESIFSMSVNVATYLQLTTKKILYLPPVSRPASSFPGKLLGQGLCYSTPTGIALHVSVSCSMSVI